MQHRCLRGLFASIHKADPSLLCPSSATAPQFITLTGLLNAARRGDVSLPITSTERLLELAHTCIVGTPSPGPSDKSASVRAAEGGPPQVHVSTSKLMSKVNSDALRTFKGLSSDTPTPNMMTSEGSTPAENVAVRVAVRKRGKGSRVQDAIDVAVGESGERPGTALGKTFSDRSSHVRFIKSAAAEKGKNKAYAPEDLAKAWLRMRGTCVFYGLCDWSSPYNLPRAATQLTLPWVLNSARGELGSGRGGEARAGAEAPAHRTCSKAASARAVGRLARASSPRDELLATLHRRYSRAWWRRRNRRFRCSCRSGLG
jgi:hypothetical protein